MTEESMTTDPTTFTCNWHDLREFNDYEGFLSWVIVNLTVDNADDTMIKFHELERATDRFTNVELKVTINDIECNTEEFIKALYYRLTDVARDTVRDELRKIEEFNNLKRAMRALEGAVRDRLESVARGFGLNLEEHIDD